MNSSLHNCKYCLTKMPCDIIVENEPIMQVEVTYCTLKFCVYSSTFLCFMIIQMFNLFLGLYSVQALCCGVQASLFAVHELESKQSQKLLLVGFSSCSMWALVVHGFSCPVVCGILLSWLRIEPMSPALKGGFLTTWSPVNSQNIHCFHFYFPQVSF